MRAHSVLAVGVAVVGAGVTAAWSSPSAATGAAVPTVIAAGDIACEVLPPARKVRCHQGYTSDVVLAADPQLVLTLGDHQYSAFLGSNWVQRYDPTWGRFKSITRPVLGNHELEPDPLTGQNSGGENYYRYFGSLAHRRSGGYYAYDVGAWRVYALNSTSAAPEQVRWLAADMAAHPHACTLGYWHHAAFNSGVPEGRQEGAGSSSRLLWDTFTAAGGDLVLSGHSHFYERLMVGNVREFVVGTGGVYFSPMAAAPTPYTEVRNGNTFGVLRLRLGPGWYAWRFLPDGHSGPFTDAGKGMCTNSASPS